MKKQEITPYEREVRQMRMIAIAKEWGFRLLFCCGGGALGGILGVLLARAIT